MLVVINNEAISRVHRELASIAWILMMGQPVIFNSVGNGEERDPSSKSPKSSKNDTNT